MKFAVNFVGSQLERRALLDFGLGYQVAIMSDPSARYFVLSLFVFDDRYVALVNRREGKSGMSYCARLFDLKDRKYWYVADDDNDNAVYLALASWEHMVDAYKDMQAGPLVPGSISDELANIIIGGQLTRTSEYRTAEVNAREAIEDEKERVRGACAARFPEFVKELAALCDEHRVIISIAHDGDDSAELHLDTFEHVGCNTANYASSEDGHLWIKEDGE